MAAAMAAAQFAEPVCGISHRRRLSSETRSLTAISWANFKSNEIRGSAFVISGASSRTSSWRSSRSWRSSAQAPCLGGAKVSAADVDGEAAGGERQREALLTKDELLMLRKKAADLSSHLQGSSIFLVGMSKSGKTTVGKCLSEALGYYFFDSKQLVEQAAGEQFSEMVEEEFENAETEVLMQLSPLVRLIVATGERAVTRPRNWGYLRTGVTVWLDWPVDSLVQRRADSESGLEKILEDTRNGLQERVAFYANADATVSIEKIAALKDLDDFSSLTPPMVAFHVLDEIDKVLKKAENSTK